MQLAQLNGLIPGAFALYFFCSADGLLAQPNDSIQRALYFKGAASVTNNGFSFIPSFTLGKPATIVNLARSGERFGFEPEFRYSPEGKSF